MRSTRSGSVSVFAGSAGGSGDADGVGELARFGGWDPRGGFSLGIHGVALDSSGNAYVTDLNGMRKITPSREVTTVTKEGQGAFRSDAGITLSGNGEIYVSLIGSILKVSTNGKASLITTERLGYTVGLPGIVADRAGNLYTVNGDTRSVLKLSLDRTNWIVSPLRVLDGAAKAATNFAFLPSAIAMNPEGQLIIADGAAVRKLTPAGTNWVASTVAGLVREVGAKDGTGTEARFNLPIYGLAVDKTGNIYVSDTCNNLVRKLTPTGVVTTLAGTLRRENLCDDGIGPGVGFDGPRGIAVDDAGNLYVGDYGNHTFRKGFPATMIDSSAADFGYRDGMFRFSAIGPRQQVAMVQVSTNLVDWKAVSTNEVGGALSVVDSSANEAMEFCRVAFPP